MKEIEELEFIYNNLLGDNAISVKLRNGEGIESIQYKELVNSIDKLISIYKKRDSVPKKLALAFFDITNSFYASQDLYSKEVFENLEDMALHLHYLGEELFSCPSVVFQEGVTTNDN